MTSIFNDIFGGGSTSSTSTSTPQNMNPFTGALQGAVTSLGTSLAGGLPQYQGPLSAPMSGNESSMLGTLMGQTGDATGRNQYLSDTMSGKYLPGQPGGNPFLQDAITAAQRTTMNNLTGTLTRDLPGRFTSAGQFNQANNNGQGGSSAFDMASALATRGAASAMGDIASNMSSTAYGQERQNQNAAVGLSQQEVQTSIANLQAQALPRMIQELGIERGMQLFQNNTQGILQLLQTLGGIAQPVIGNNQTSTSTGDTTKGILPDLYSPVKSGTVAA